MSPEDDDGPAFLATCRHYAARYHQAPGSCPPELRVVVMALAGAPAASYDEGAPDILDDAAARFLAITEETGDVRGADAAITCLRAALPVAGEDHLGRPGYLASLSMALLSRFEELGKRDDIEAAAAAAGQAVDLAAPGAAELGRFWSGRAATLTARAAAYEDPGRP